MNVLRGAILLGFLALASRAAPGVAAEIPGAIIVLQAAPGSPGTEAPGAPPRFVLLKDGQVFVGGSSRVEAGRLAGPELGALRRRAEAARKALGRAGRLTLVGDESKAVRLRLPQDGPTDVSIDPEDVPPGLEPVAALVSDLLRFDHPSLTPFSPTSYALAAREGALVGGCRPWSFSFPIEQAIAVPLALSAAEATGWPKGAMPASVCAGEKRYVVTLRPLLPGEQP